MNILFIQRNYNLGGVNVVTATIANRFADEGHHVSLYVFDVDMWGAEHLLSKAIHQYVGVGYNRFYMRNVHLLRKAIRMEKPDLIVNNWALNPYITRTVNWAVALEKIKLHIWSEYHSAPNHNTRAALCDEILASDAVWYKKWIARLKKVVAQYVAKSVLRYTYRNSDGFMVLASGYVADFCRFTGIKPSEKVWAQINPLTINAEHFVLDPSTKQKEILYVGRLDPKNKKVSRMLDVWQLLYETHPDWRLTVLGDGPEFEILQKRIADESIPRVSLEGKKDPVSYYQRASILGLCSDFEGFPLVLGEAMAFGCIPVAYGSVSSIYDIVDDNINGVITSASHGFSAEEMAREMAKLMDNNELLNRMMPQAMQKSKELSVDVIYGQWKQKINERLGMKI